MRKIIDFQIKLGETLIENIQFDLSSRDEIPKLLIGLQAIWSDRKIRDQVFSILTELIPGGVDPGNGRPGMDLWKILVLGTLRLNCNWDYDKLQDIANNHKKVREMLGHILTFGEQIYDSNDFYALQTLKDNIALFTPLILQKINQIVVKYGHELIGKKAQLLNGSCDSVVVETDVHFPTDINLLYDAARKMIMIIMNLCQVLGIEGWRQWGHNLKKVKQFFNIARKIQRSNSNNPEKKAQRENAIKEAHQAYMDVVEEFIKKTNETIKFICYCPIELIGRLVELEIYIQHAERQIKQIRQRVIECGTIPHGEKVFSIFEEHTEWISKGKAGVSQELGLRVCILKDQFGFILCHRVMEKETDDKVAVPMVKETQDMFPEMRQCSFDKGFHSPKNQEELAKILDKVILPRKGRLSERDKAVEHSEEFIEALRKHSAVESAINGLEQGGLDRCPDHGIDGFKRYVALAVLARNLHTLGHMVQQKKLKQQIKLKKAA